LIIFKSAVTGGVLKKPFFEMQEVQHV